MSPVADQYAVADLRRRVQDALRAAGKDPDALTPDDLAGFTEFHALGRMGTIGLLTAAGVRPGETVLDAGSGVGGTARLLAAEHGCDVVAVDLTPEFCELARWLNEAVGLSARIDVRQGDVTDLPLPDASVSLVVSQHVQMNVADKARLYREARRVLAPGGRLAMWDVAAGLEQPIVFPVPWADVPERSFLATPDELAAAVEAAGLAFTTFDDLTDFAIEAMSGLFSAPPDPLGLGVIVPDIAAKGANIVRNAREGRLRLIQAVAVAPS